MPQTLTFGLFSLNSGACSYPATAARVAQAAEATGFDSLWAGEHVVLPDPRVPPSPLAPEERILDPIVTLTFLAAQTKRVLLGTGIIILPQRNPLVLAKELVSLDELSEGRLLFGLGVGYLEPEFRALGIPFADRGARSKEYLAAMRAIWREPKPAYHGQFVSFANVQAHPQGNIRIVMGGRSSAHTRSRASCECVRARSVCGERGNHADRAHLIQAPTVTHLQGNEAMRYPAQRKHELLGECPRTCPIVAIFAIRRLPRILGSG